MKLGTILEDLSLFIILFNEIFINWFTMRKLFFFIFGKKVIFYVVLCQEWANFGGENVKDG